MRKLSLSLAVAILLAVVVVYSVAQKKAGASDAQYVTQALSAAPKAVAKDASVARMDDSGKMTTLRKGKNGFTCNLRGTRPT